MIKRKPKPTGIKVKPRSRKAIRNIATEARRLLGVDSPYANIIDILEFKLPIFGVVYEICTKEEMGDDHGLTIPDQNLIKIREDVYEGACNNNGRDRFTICHEIGHLLLHRDISFARSQTTSNNHEWFEDAEWQADTFSAEFLMPFTDIIIGCKTVEEVMNTFGVSNKAASIRFKDVRKQGIV